MQDAAAAPNPAEAARLMRRATIAAVSVAMVLIAFKLSVWVLTGSVSILSSLVDSMLDAAASLVNLLAVRHALTPADREHRFGHGKAEPLAALGQAGFVAGSAVFIVMEAIDHLVNPVPVRAPAVGIVVMLVSTAITLGLITYQRHVVRRTRSLAITADELHYRGDVLLNGSVVAALLLTAWTGSTVIDPLAGAAIAGFIVFSAYRIARLALDGLMDRELPDETRARIRALAMAHPEVLAVHDLRSRAAGPDIFIQLHLEMAPEMMLSRAHVISDAVEAAIRDAFPNAEVIIHQDPAGIEEERRNFAAR